MNKDYKLVNVLISTYNGEKYISEQLESILQQTYSNIKIWVRDDGSSDATLNILKKYESAGRIFLMEGSNVGFGRSFLELLKNAEEGDYWAFCDQDDVWDREKIERAVNALSVKEDTYPYMYFHNFVLTNEKLEDMSIYRNQIPGYSFQMAITECLHMGFATVINKALRTYMLTGDISKVPSHDWWAELIVMQFGEVITDDYIGAKHRRLDSSLSGNGLRNRIKWLKKALKGNAEISGLTRCFLDTFSDRISDVDGKLLGLFVFKKYSLTKAIKKCFFSKRWRTSMFSEMVLRFLMLIGKV